MRSAESRVETSQAGRYLTQLCRHAEKLERRHFIGMHGSGPRPELRRLEWTDTDGTLALSWGTCTLHAEPDALTVRVTAATEEDLVRVKEIVTANLERFGRRDGLVVTWTHQDTTPTS